MSLDAEITEKYVSLFSDHETLKRKGKELEPLVLKHFNNYVDTVINPTLPAGISFIKSDRVQYSDGKFFVYAGPYLSHRGLIPELVEIEDIVNKLIIDYKKMSPWIEDICECKSLCD